MPIHDDLIRENAELAARLALAEKWMRREVQSAIRSVKRAEVTKDTRRHFQNTFETDGVEMITQRIIDIFGDTLSHAPKYTLERLIDAEIYWETLQKYPTLDALPIVTSYQKILDAWIEEVLVGPWRNSVITKGILKNTSSPAQSSLEKDIQNIYTKNYTLSIGRLYQILRFEKDNTSSSPLIREMMNFWESSFPHILENLVSVDFLAQFGELMDREIFSKKRHEKKVSYGDAKWTRDILIGSGESLGFLQKILSE